MSFVLSLVINDDPSVTLQAPATTTLLGDVVGSGLGTFAVTISSNAVTFDKFQSIANGALLGRSTAGTGNVEQITLGDNLTLVGGVLSATGGGGVALSNTSPWTAPQPLNAGALMTGADPNVNNDPNAGYMFSAVVTTKGVGLNPNFVDSGIFNMHLKVLQGQYSYGGGTNAKLTSFVRNSTVDSYGAVQKFIDIDTLNSYAMGDAFDCVRNVTSWGGPIAGDEGVAFESFGNLGQPSSLSLMNCTAVVQTTQHTTTLGAVTADKDPQDVHVNSTTGMAAGQWWIADDAPQSGFPNMEAVQLISVNAGAGTVNAVFKNNHTGGATFNQALVLTVDDSGTVGEGRTLVNLSGASYSTGTIASVAVNVFTGSGTAWNSGVVGGNSKNTGAIALTLDDYVGSPFNGTGANGPLKSWYPISTVTDGTHLTIHRYSTAGSENYVGAGSGAYVIRPAVQVLRMLNSQGQGPCDLVCESTSSVWSVNDHLELSICPWIDTCGFQYDAHIYTRGATCRSFWNVRNSGSQQWESGGKIDGSSAFNTQFFPTGFLSGWEAGGCDWGFTSLGNRLGAIQILVNTDVGGGIVWSPGQFIRTSAGFQGMDMFLVESNNSGVDGHLRTAGTGHTGGASVFQWTGIMGVAGNVNAGTDGIFRFYADDGGHTMTTVGAVDMHHRVLTSSIVLGSVHSLDFIPIDSGLGVFCIGQDKVAQGLAGSPATNGSNTLSCTFNQYASVWNGSAAVTCYANTQAVCADGNAANSRMGWQIEMRTVTGATVAPFVVVEDGLLIFGDFDLSGTNKRVAFDPRTLTTTRTQVVPDFDGTINVTKSGRFTGLTAAKATVLSFTTGPSDSSYEVGANANVTAASSASFTSTVTYTDETNVSRTATFTFTQAGTAAPIQTITNTTGVGAYSGHSFQIRCKANTTVTFATVGTFGSITYNIENQATLKSADPVVTSGPTVSSLAPGTAFVSNNRMQVITGTGFSGVTAVTFNGVNVGWFDVISTTTINAVGLPETATGAKDVVVTTGAGSGTGAGAITYSQATIGTTVSGSIALTSSRQIWQAVLGPDAKVWWPALDELFVVDTSGTVTSHSTGTTGVPMGGICVAGDGNLWFTDFKGSIYKSTTSGTVTPYVLDQTDGGATVLPQAVCTGPSGIPYAVGYKSDGSQGYVWKVNLDGTSTRFTITNAAFYAVFLGPDGNLWCFGNDQTFATGRVVLVNPSGTEVARHDLVNSGLFEGAVSHDNKAWFVDFDGNYWIVDPSNWAGAASFPLDAGAQPVFVIAGPDGKMWISAVFTSTDSKVYKVSLNGTIASTITVTGSHSGEANDGVYGLAAGADGAVWGAVFTSGVDGFAFKVT